MNKTLENIIIDFGKFNISLNILLISKIHMQYTFSAEYSIQNILHEIKSNLSCQYKTSLNFSNTKYRKEKHFDHTCSDNFS